MGRSCSTYGVVEWCLQVFFCEETSWKEITWKIRRRWEDNIKMDLISLGRGFIDWIDLSIGTDGRMLCMR